MQIFRGGTKTKKGLRLEFKDGKVPTQTRWPPPIFSARGRTPSGESSREKRNLHREDGVDEGSCWLCPGVEESQGDVAVVARGCPWFCALLLRRSSYRTAVVLQAKCTSLARSSPPPRMLIRPSCLQGIVAAVKLQGTLGVVIVALRTPCERNEARGKQQLQVALQPAKNTRESSGCRGATLQRAARQAQNTRVHGLVLGRCSSHFGCSKVLCFGSLACIPSSRT